MKKRFFPLKSLREYFFWGEEGEKVLSVKEQAPSAEQALFMISLLN
jgi:hypothetical protein